AREPRVTIPDPYTMSEPGVRDVLVQIREAIDGLSAWLEGRGATALAAHAADRSTMGREDARPGMPPEGRSSSGAVDGGGPRWPGPGSAAATRGSSGEFDPGPGKKGGDRPCVG